MIDMPSGYKKYFTACLELTGKPCLVVGGGDVARRKAAGLKDAGARIAVVSPKLDPVLEYMSFQKEITWKEKTFEPSDLNGAFLVIAATNNREVNQTIATLCREQNILCNVADQSEEGSFIVPTTIERGPLTLAISTSGISPILASNIRQELELAYGEEYGLFLELLAPLRKMIQAEFTSPQQRQRIYERMISSRVLSLLRSGMQEQAEKELKEIIYKAKEEPRHPSGGSLPIVNR